MRYGRADVLVLLDRDFPEGQEFTVEIRYGLGLRLVRRWRGMGQVSKGGGQESHIFVGSVIGGRHKAGSLSLTSVTRGLT